jgi:serine/threonine protein kinase
MGSRGPSDEPTVDGDAERTIGATISPRAPETDPADLPPGTTIDETFRIERVLGAGAMGVVYEARDLELDRRVAIKLHAFSDAHRSGRMWREAKAMAQLSHPNVIAVHAVGRYRDRVFIAMELVDGGTVGEWMETPRTWKEVVDVFVQGARGLAAAHRQGLIHRDFKPDNMLIGSDGRVRVADFGLARAAGTTTDESVDREHPFDDLASAVSVENRLTRTGAMVGTPAYMAPEQVAGARIDARADQFSFFVALHEALYGVRPFAGTTLAEVLSAATLGEVTAPPTDRGVPGWLYAVVLRGLRPDPGARYPDMDAVVAVLEADPGRRRRRAALAIGVVGAIAATAWISRSSAADPCRTAGDAVADTYDATVATRVETSLRDVDPTLGGASASRVRPPLDAYAEQLTQQRIEACRASQRGEQSDALLDLRVACLDRRQTELGAVLGVLTKDPDLDVVERALDLVGGLPDLGPCSDSESLRSRTAAPDDATAAAEIDATAAAAAETRAAHAAGHVQTAAARVPALLETAERLAYAPLLAELLHLHGQIERELRHGESASRAFARAYRYAVQGGVPALARDAASDLAATLGERPARYDEASRWLEAAEGWQARQPADDVLGRTALAVTRAGLLFAADRYTEAADIAAASLREIRRVPPTLATRRRELDLLVELGVNLQRRSMRDAAERTLDEAVALAGEAYGPDHPRLATVLAAAAPVVGAVGDPARGLQYADRASAIVRATYGEASLRFAKSLLVVALVQADAGRIDDAVATNERALAIARAAGGENDPIVARLMSNLSGELRQVGQSERAQQLAVDALALLDEVYGADSLKSAQARLGVAAGLGVAGHYEEALEQFERSRTSFLAHYGPAHQEILLVELNIALSARFIGEYRRAHAALGRADAVAEALGDTSLLTRARIASSRAKVFDLQERTEDALAEGTRAARLYEDTRVRSPEFAREALTHAERLRDAGQPQEAARLLSLCIEICDERSIGGNLPILARWMLRGLGTVDETTRQQLAAEASARLAGLEAPLPDPDLEAEIRQWAARRR